MYGVPADLPLDRFIGREIDPILIGQFQVDFAINGAGNVIARSGWELRDPSGSLIDSEVDHADRDCYRVHRIIGIPIVGFAIDPPGSFTLNFESGHTLKILDDSEQYESFEIQFDGDQTYFI